MSDTRTSLYRHFSADGSLLYVGVSLSWPMRTKAHSRGAEWFSQIAKVTLEHFPTREEALAAERAAIVSEKPKFNVIHNRPRVSVKEAGQRRAKGLGGQLGYITGPVALVGPALVYDANDVSVLVAWGTPGTAGELTEIVLGELAPEVPAWADACTSVLTILDAGQITISQARSLRLKIIRELASRRIKVDAFETDLALAQAYSSRFPSEESRRILSDIAHEVKK